MTKTAQPLVIGVICNGYNNEDIAYYENEFRLINVLFKDHVKVIFIGSTGELLPEETEYTKPVSINHYFKHIHHLSVDLLFIPLQPTIFNQTSENYNKFMEASLFGIPIMTVNQYPYNSIVKSGRNGFLYESRETFIAELKDLLIDNLTDVKMCGLNAYETTTVRLSYTDENISAMLNAFD
jgi:hypothetical protein